MMAKAQIPFDPRIGYRIKMCRIDAEMAQYKLADEIDVHVGTLQSWEYGRRAVSIEGLVRIADVLNADIRELIYGGDYEGVD